MFEERNAYKLKKLFELNDTCESCNHSFSPEPRYYDGAMYISYGISVAIVITIFVAFNILFENPNYDLMIGITIGLAVLLSPLSFRISRSLWVHIFVSYDGSTEDKNEAHKAKIK